MITLHTLFMDMWSDNEVELFVVIDFEIYLNESKDGTHFEFDKLKTSLNSAGRR